jgi:hypothetical protein
MSDDFTLVGYADATWVGRQGTDPLSRSTSGYCFFLGGDLLSWKSSVQKRPALSSTDAEIISASEAARDAVWLRNFLWELGLSQSAPTVIYEDNRGAEEIARNGAVRDPLKHILLREHYLFWAVEEKFVKLVRVDTKNQTADILTKPLSPLPFDLLRARFLSQ